VVEGLEDTTYKENKQTQIQVRLNRNGCHILANAAPSHSGKTSKKSLCPVLPDVGSLDARDDDLAY
jgi:hypothetical protein